ncbi:MurR/RpiR family transcriptional regulator [Sneathiella limimaris]|uniref:MurR/RpiR family transcriptional regulator n=1 Tax=Sneathiella limimaris TaxID=1964213 RepID=UPI00146D4EB7|nr:MurR/RpiR family transcriptional regulator [Sneathiella limimaris]
MAEEDIKSIEARIHETYDDFSETERKIADVILDYPGDLSAFTATELASLAGVSKASSSRFFQRLGYSSFEEARKLAREIKNWGSPLYRQGKSSPQHINFKEFFDHEIELLKTTIGNIHPNTIDEITQAIVASKRIWIVGFRNSYFLAGYLRWQLLQFRGDVNLLPNPGETFGEFTADMIESDLLIAVGLRRRPRELGQIIQSAEKSGANRLLITDPTARRLPSLVDWTLTVQTASPFVFDSCSSAISLLRLIAVTALQKAGKPGRDHLKRVERQHEILGDLNH